MDILGVVELKSSLDFEENGDSVSMEYS